MKETHQLKYLFQKNVSLKRRKHNCLDLQKALEQDLHPRKSAPGLSDSLRFEYHLNVPQSVLEDLQVDHAHCIDRKTSAVIVLFNDTPIGCFLFNLEGKAKITQPFSYRIDFGRDHAYGFLLFIKKEFRGRGIAKPLYFESIRILRKDFKYLDILVDKGNFVSDKLAQEIGFIKIQDIMIVKLAFFNAVIKLNNGFKIVIYDVLLAVSKILFDSSKAFLRFMLAAATKAKALKQNLLLKVHRVHDLQNSTRIAYFSRKGLDEVILTRIFPDGYRVDSGKMILRKNVSQELDHLSESDDLVIIDGNFEYLNNEIDFLKDASFSPKWVRQIKYPPLGLDCFSRNRDHNVCCKINATKKYNYQYVFTQNSDLLYFFYNSMYLPYARGRYGDQAILVSFKEIKNSFDKGGLLFVVDNGKYVSGAVIETKDDILRPIKIGVYNGDFELVKKEAISALYCYFFDFADQNGFKQLDFGLSRSFLNDGVLQFKARWRADISLDREHSGFFMMKINRYTEAIKSFLIKNPFITLDHERLIGNMFVDESATDSKIKKEINKYKLGGLSGLKVSTVDDAYGHKPHCELDLS